MEKLIIGAMLAVLASGCTVYTYDGPPPSYAYYQPAPMVVRAPVRYWSVHWARQYVVVPGRRNEPCRGRR